MIAVFRGGTRALFDSDTFSYLEPGRNLLLHGRFFADGVPDLVRTPGYPLFLAITSLAGFPAAAVANVLLSVFSIYLVWRIGRTAFDDNRIALCAAWLFAFEPLSVIYSVLLISDTLFLAIFLLSMERLAVFLRERRLRVLVASGLWLAAATYVRPVSYYLPVALALGLLVVLARVPPMRWKAPAMLLISVLPWLAAWQIRNWVETGYGGFSSITEINRYFNIAAGVTASVEHRPFLEVRHDLGFYKFADQSGQIYLSEPYLARHPEQAGWNQNQRIAFMRSEADRIIRAHYGDYLRCCVLTPFFKTAFNPGEGNFSRLVILREDEQNSGLIDQGPVHWGIVLIKTNPRVAAEKGSFEVVLLGLYLLAAWGVFRNRPHKATLWLLLGTSLYFFAVSAVAGGVGADARYRLPSMPYVCILAAAGVQRLRSLPAGKEHC